MKNYAILNINLFGKVTNPLNSAKSFYESVREMGLHVAFVNPWIILSKKKLTKNEVKKKLKIYEQNLTVNKIKIIGMLKNRKIYIFSEKTPQ